MKQYLNLLNKVLVEGTDRPDRTGTGTRSLFGQQMRFNLQEGFPLVTTRKIHTKSLIHELLWFIKGDTNTKYLEDNGVTFWREWQDENGDLGAIYGKQWRSWGKANGSTVDQLKEVIEGIKTNPNSRRNLVSAWNVGELDQMALSPCHVMFQFYVANGKLSCHLYQRSGDLFLGIPYNIASYSILTHMIAKECGLAVGEFIHTIGDTHIYHNHIDQVKIQLNRKERKLPTLWLNPDVKSVFDYTFDDIKILGYDPHPHLKGKVAI